MKSEFEISRNSVASILSHREKLQKVCASLAKTPCQYYNPETGKTEHSKDSLDFVLMGDLTMRDVQKILEII